MLNTQTAGDRRLRNSWTRGPPGARLVPAAAYDPATHKATIEKLGFSGPAANVVLSASGVEVPDVVALVDKNERSFVAWTQALPQLDFGTVLVDPVSVGVNTLAVVGRMPR